MEPENFFDQFLVPRFLNRFKRNHDDFPGIDVNIVIPWESYWGDFPDLFHRQYESPETYLTAIGAAPDTAEKIRRKMTA